MAKPPRILMAFADSDPGRRLAAIKREEEELLGVFDRLTESEGFDDPVVLAGATPQGIVKAFQRRAVRNSVRVFHFGGHASRSEVMLTKISGGPSPTSAKVLADYLGIQSGLALVFLNACHTRAQVEHLRRAGIGAVVSTSSAILDEVAADFAVNFYTELLDRPLRMAFEAAAAATALGSSGSSRQLVDDDASAADQVCPWYLDCADEEWTLVLPPDAGSAGTGAGSSRVKVIVDGKVLVDELARVIHESDEAILILRRAKFPVGMIPRFTTSLAFWSRVVDLVEGGVLAGGLRAVAGAAAELYPHNEVFARYGARAEVPEPLGSP